MNKHQVRCAALPQQRICPMRWGRRDNHVRTQRRCHLTRQGGTSEKPTQDTLLRTSSLQAVRKCPIVHAPVCGGFLQQSGQINRHLENPSISHPGHALVSLWANCFLRLHTFLRPPSTPPVPEPSQAKHTHPGPLGMGESQDPSLCSGCGHVRHIEKAHSCQATAQGP